jgi:short-subunit dehydrogenase
MNVVVTGARQGIGKAVAEQFARMGCDLFLCSRNMDSTQSWQQSLMREQGVKVMSLNVDMTDREATVAFAASVLDAMGHVDVLVNNAGLFEPGSVHNEPEGQLEKMLAVNLYSAYHLTRALLPSMMKRRSGHIFNLCSIASVQAYAAGGSYSISKFAMLGFSKNLREEMKPHNVKVTSVLPGATMTGSWDGAGIPAERIMEAEDIAKLIASAASLSPQACVEEILVRPQLGDL